MINGMWQGQLLDADEVAVTEEFETKIRKAGASHELRCTDPECKCFICYKHGKKRKPHFAHIGESECAYAQFEKQDTSDKKSVRSALYTHFTSLGYDVKREVRLPNGRKYCDLLLNINDQNIVLRIALSTTSATYIEEYTKECEQSDCKLLWIAIGDPYDVHYEKHHYHAMRYQFNHTTNKNLLIIDHDATMVSQIKEDNARYEYKGHLLDYKYFLEAVHNFQIVRPVSELRIVDGELTIDSFSDEYNAWIERKQAALEKMKAAIDAEEIRRAEAERLRAKQFEEARKRRLQMQMRRKGEAMANELDRTKVEYPKSLSNINLVEAVDNTPFERVSTIRDEINKQNYEKEQQQKYEKGYKYIVENNIIDSSEFPTDQYGYRWLRCEICGKLKRENEMVSYCRQSGECRDCNRTKNKMS